MERSRPGNGREFGRLCKQIATKQGLICERMHKSEAFAKGMILLCDKKCDWLPQYNGNRPCRWGKAADRPLDPETKQWILLWYFGHYGAIRAIRTIRVCQICQMLNRSETQVRAVIDTMLPAVR